MDFTRRSIVFGLLAAGLAADEALAATRRRPKSKARPRRSPKGKSRQAAPAAPVQPKKPDGNPLRIPTLVDLDPASPTTLTAGKVDHAFVPDKPAPVAGYGGQHLGPALRIRRGTAPTVTLVNGLDRATNLHWHGLLVEGTADGGHAAVAPGASWSATLACDQPSATCWYHAHGHGRVGEDIHDGLAGFLIVEDPADARLGLPSEWGVDDIPLLIQDKLFDADGRPAYRRDRGTVDHGFRGDRIVVNGTLDAVAEVPQRLVRLRLLNASSARIYRFYFEDERPFRLIATDGGFLAAPVEADTVSLSPGERVEILVDFADGGTALMSTPDEHEHRMGTRTMRIPDSFAAPFRICAFTTEKDGKPSARVPEALAALGEAVEPAQATTRRFVLQLSGGAPLSKSAAHLHDAHAGHGAMASAEADLPVMAINGKTFDPTRIDETVPLGATEIWEVVSPEMAHPFHVHGAHVRVLTEDGGIPKIWNRGVKDTVLVENSARLLVTFTKAAPPTAPFMYHCHVLEHEDAGMMGTFVVKT